MHQSSLDLMKELLTNYQKDFICKSVLDVGSLGAGGCYRYICEELGLLYTGCDIVGGNNVDIVVPEEGPWDLPQSYCIVISGQCMEHVRNPFKWMRKIAGAVSLGGHVFIIAPNTWQFHEHPVDCWRVWPDGMKETFLDTGCLKMIECKAVGPDTYGVARRKTSGDY